MQCRQRRYLAAAPWFALFGAGHGLGISQWGAKRLAKTGKSYADILHHYYTGVTLQTDSY